MEYCPTCRNVIFETEADAAAVLGAAKLPAVDASGSSTIVSCGTGWHVPVEAFDLERLEPILPARGSLRWPAQDFGALDPSGFSDLGQD